MPSELLRAAEKTFETDRANRARTEGMLRDAEATIRDLREKLATANQILRTVEAEPADERLTKPSANDGVIVAREAVHPSAPEPTVPTVRRLVGRPRKTAIVESGEHPIWSIITPRVIPDTTIPTVRRRVGRPRKTTAAQLVEKPFKPPEKPQAFAKAGTMKARKDADDDEPVQWWVEGWKKR